MISFVSVNECHSSFQWGQPCLKSSLRGPEVQNGEVLDVEEGPEQSMKSSGVCNDTGL